MDKKDVNKYLPLFTTLIVTVYLLDTFTQDRFVSLGGHYVCSAIFVFPLAYTLFDMVAEIYGYKKSKQILWCAMLAWLISGVFIAIVIKLPYPILHAQYDQKFNEVMRSYPKTIIVASSAVLIGQFVNIYLISKLRILTRGKYFLLRSIFSTFVADILTVSISLIGFFFGEAKIVDLIKLILFEFFIAQSYHIIAAIPASFITYHLKKFENQQLNELSSNFNPFKLDVD